MSPNLVDLHKKSVNMGPIMTPPKNPETWVKLVVKCWQLTIFDKVLEDVPVIETFFDAKLSI